MSHAQNPMVQPRDPAAMIPSNPKVESDKISKYCSQRLWQHLEACSPYFSTTPRPTRWKVRSPRESLPQTGEEVSIPAENRWLFKIRRCLNGWTDVKPTWPTKQLYIEIAAHRLLATISIYHSTAFLSVAVQVLGENRDFRSRIQEVVVEHLNHFSCFACRKCIQGNN